MFKILDWYIGRTIIATSSLCLVTLVGLSGIIKYVDQLRKVGRGSYDLLEAGYFVLLSIPRDIELFFPMAALLGALIGLGMLASSSELVVMQASGFSKLNISNSVLKTAIPLMLLVMLIGQWGAPQAQKLARDSRAEAIYGGNILSVQNGVWAKDGDDFIYIGQVTEEKDLRGISLWTFDKDKNLTAIMRSPKATYLEGNTWTLHQVQKINIDNDVQISKEVLKTLPWETTLTPDKLGVVTIKPEELSISGLYSYMTYLKDSEQDASRYELAFWRKIFQPISIAVMMLMALSFIFGPLRSVTMGARILAGVIAGFSFYIASEVFGPVSLVYSIPPIVGALAPSVIFLMVAILLLRRKA